MEDFQLAAQSFLDKVPGVSYLFYQSSSWAHLSDYLGIASGPILGSGWLPVSVSQPEF